MKTQTREILNELTERYPALKATAPQIEAAFRVINDCFANGGRLYLCGNGGSASDCEHIAGELLKSFRLARPIDEAYAACLNAMGEEGKKLASVLEAGFPVTTLLSHPAFISAFANDSDPNLVYAQQVSVLANEGDVLLAISTSGNAGNCAYAAIAAKAKGAKVVFLGGGTGGKLAKLCDCAVIVPEKETYKVQELHLPVYHCLCAMLESERFA